MLTKVCSTIQPFSDINAHAMRFHLVCGPKNRFVHVDFCAPRLRSVTQALGRGDVSERVCGCAFKRAQLTSSQWLEPFAQTCTCPIQNDTFARSKRTSKTRARNKIARSMAQKKTLFEAAALMRGPVRRHGEEACDKRNDSEVPLIAHRKRLTSAEHVRYISGASITES